MLHHPAENGPVLDLPGSRAAQGLGGFSRLLYKINGKFDRGKIAGCGHGDLLYGSFCAILPLFAIL
jgi:hypothetical protein